MLILKPLSLGILSRVAYLRRRHIFALGAVAPFRLDDPTRLTFEPAFWKAAASSKQSRDESNGIERNPSRSSGDEEGGYFTRFIAYHTGTAVANRRMISAYPPYGPNIVSAKTRALIGCALLRGSSAPRRAAHSRTPIPGGITLPPGPFLPIDN